MSSFQHERTAIFSFSLLVTQTVYRDSVLTLRQTIIYGSFNFISPYVLTLPCEPSVNVLQTIHDGVLENGFCATTNLLSLSSHNDFLFMISPRFPSKMLAFEAALVSLT